MFALIGWTIALLLLWILLGILYLLSNMFGSKKPDTLYAKFVTFPLRVLAKMVK